MTLPPPARRLIAVATVATLAVASWAAAPAAAGPPPPVAVSPSPAADPAGQATTSRVTLLTGDVVEYTEVPGGLPGVAIEPARRPDGEAVTFTSFPDGEGGYLVLPSDAAPLVADGTLDQQLFDVVTLIEDGLATGQPPPVIVDYRPAGPGAADATGAAGALAGAAVTRQLAALDAVAVEVAAGQAAGFWADLQTGTAGIETIWLDRPARLLLDQSAATVGAPAARELGLDGTGTTIAVVDTGIDLDHPDFAGRVTATANFTEDPDVTDHIGHGTHVASIAAGSGAASDGRYTGIAPGASLLAAKVFDQTGFGSTSGVIAGMEWAAAQGADVVNLSLGICCSFGADPVSLAVDALTEQYGTLFVASMGNDGQRLRVPAPAAADQALAVAAGDKATGTRVVGISNGGPRHGDAAVKPNLVAPGDGIVAARAAGTPGRPGIDPDYTLKGGTSMAAPHVAGAAALLAQQHPDWTTQQLRDALESTAATLDPEQFRWFDQGAGRLDLARAVSQPVHATGTLDFHVVGAETGRPVTYRNNGADPVTLQLSVTTQGWSGNPAPAGAVRLAAGTVTVPAGGAASVQLLVDPDAGAPGAYGGWVQARSADGTVALATSFGYFSGPPLRELDVQVHNGYGTAELSDRAWFILRPVQWSPDPDNPWNPTQVQATANEQGQIRFRVPAGDYELWTSVPEATIRGRHSIVRQPVALQADTAVTVTPEGTVPLTPVTPEPTDLIGADVRYLRDTGDPRGPSGMSVSASRLSNGVWATPLAAPATGAHQLAHQSTLDQARLVRASMVGRSGWRALDPAYRADRIGDRLAGRHRYPVSFAGTGQPGDLAGQDLAGRLALLAVPVDLAGPDPYQSAIAALADGMAAALAAGAAGVLGYLDIDGAEAVPPEVAGLALGLPADQGRALRAAAERGRATVTLAGRAEPETGYRLRYDYQQTSPDRAERVSVPELARVRVDYHADRAGVAGSEQVATDGPAGPLRPLASPVTPPASRTLYFGPARPELTWTRQVRHDGRTFNVIDRFQPGEHRPAEHWFRAPQRPGPVEVPAGSPDAPLCTLCRDGDRLVPFFYWLDDDPARWATDRVLVSGTQARLFRLDPSGTEEEIPLRFGRPRWFPVPEQAGWYRLESIDRSRRALASEVTTVARFRSGPPSGQPAGYRCSFAEACEFLPVIQVGYQLPLDLRNQAPAGDEFGFVLSTGAHPAAPERPAVTTLSVEYSVDDGASWTPARVTAHPAGDRYHVVVPHPELSATNGFVSLRVTATDAAGGSLQQTITRAYALR